MTRHALLLLTLFCACSSSEFVPFATEGEVDYYAVLELEDGVVTRVTGVLPFSGSAPAFFRGDAIAVGWSSDALAGLELPEAGVLAASPLTPASGCEPPLPAPTVAVGLGDERTIDPATLPAFTAEWLRDVCPLVDPSAIAFDVECKLFRCPLTTTPRSRCRFDFDLDCELGRFAGTLLPNGQLCLEPEAPLACEPVAYEAPRAARYSCTAPELCELDVYVESDVDLEVEAIRFLDVPPFSPTPDLIGQLVLPPVASRFFGYAHDYAISGDRVAISVGPGVAFTGCEFTSGVIDVYDVETLTRTASSAVSGCVQRLVADPNGFLGLRTTDGRFELTRFAFDGRITESVLADPRAFAGAGEPPLLFSFDARASYFDVVGDRVVAAVVSGSPASTKVFTWDAATLEPRTRRLLEGVTIVDGAKVDSTTAVLADTTAPAVDWFDVRGGDVSDVVRFPPEINRRDHIASDVAWVGDRALFTLSRKNAGVYPVTRAGVQSRAVIIDDDARPMATLAWPDAPLALVAGTSSTNQVDWPATLTLFDLETNRFLPGNVPSGHGAPGRMLADGRGRIWVLMPWDARLLRVRRGS